MSTDYIDFTTDGSNYTCSVQNFTNLDEYVADTWSNTKRIIGNHKHTIRFGNTNDIGALIDGDDPQSYVMGLLAGAILTFCIFIFWVLLLLAFKCCGPKRVGFLSGSRIYAPRPPSPTEEGNEGGGGESEVIEQHSNKGDAIIKWEEEVHKVERSLRWLRIAVLITGVAIIVCVVLFVTKGVTGLSNTVYSVDVGVGRIEEVVHDIIDLIDTFVQDQSEIGNQTSAFLEEFDGICTDKRAELCLEYALAETCTLEDIFPERLEGIEEVRDEIQTFIDDTTEFVQNEVAGISEDLREILVVTGDVRSALNQFDWAFWVAAGFGITLAVLCLFIMATIILAWTRKLGTPIACLRSWFVMPLFLFLVFMGMLFSVVFMIGSTAASDTCYNNPDTKLVNWIQEFNFNSVITKLGVYYVSGCPGLSQGEAPYISTEIISEGLELFGTIGTVLTEIRNAVRNEIQEFCGGDVTENVQTVGDLTEAQVCVLAETLTKVRLLFYCSNWRPIYTAFMWDAICYNGVDGMTWIFSTQIAIVVLAMIIVTLRVAFYPLEEEPVEALSCCRSWFCCCINSQEPDGDAIVGEQAVAYQQETAPMAATAEEVREINPKDVEPVKDGVEQ